VYEKQALIDMIREQALTFGDFTLASGKRASYYLDCRRITLDARGVSLVAAGMLDELSRDWPDAVGGMAVGADPITGALLALAGSQARPLRGVIVRKEPKGHGTGKYVEGPVVPGDRVVVVEDVVTTGGSALKAIERCEAFGLRVCGVLAIVDRLEGGADAFAARGCPLTTLLTIHDLGEKKGSGLNRAQFPEGRSGD